MNEIEYLYTEGKIGDKATPVPVRLNGVIVGSIKFTDGKYKGSPEGWSYFPKGSKVGGEVFDTIDEVQKTLRDEFE